jgi:TetR/AcrR family transcriptional regulator, transcriptional repressor for nem operon
VPEVREVASQQVIRSKWTAKSLAFHAQAVLQGAFNLAKAKGDAAIASESIEHLRRYVEHLFRQRTMKEPTA